MARPRQFDELAVLEAAGEIFWAKGYEGTSTRDLTERMGLTTASLYNAFGDKRTLFRRALTYYLDRILRERITRLEATVSPAQAITSFFDEVIERSLQDDRRRGCMLVNSALEVTQGDPELSALVADELTKIERFFHGRLVAGQRTGEIAAEHAAADAATHLLSVLLGVRVFARVRCEREILSSALRPALAMLGLPPLRHDTART